MIWNFLKLSKCFKGWMHQKASPALFWVQFKLLSHNLPHSSSSSKNLQSTFPLQYKDLWMQVLLCGHANSVALQVTKNIFSQGFISRFHLQTNLPHPISSDESAQSTRPSQISLGFIDFRCSLQVQLSSSVPSSQSWILSQRWFKLITCEILKASKLEVKLLWNWLTYLVQRNVSARMSFLTTVLFTVSASSGTLIGSIEVELAVAASSVALLPSKRSSQFMVHSISSSPPKQSTNPSHLCDLAMHLLPPHTQVWPGHRWCGTIRGNGCLGSVFSRIQSM